jgi:beta-glucanase (GH16 family)
MTVNSLGSSSTNMSRTEDVDIRENATSSGGTDAPMKMTEGERHFGGRHFNAKVKKRRRRRAFASVTIVIALLAAVVVFSPGLRSNVTALAAMDHPQGQSGVWRLAFNDDFNGTDLPDNKWNRCYPSAQPNGCSNPPEQQWYQSKNVSVSDGLLHLTAKKESVNGFPYTSGMVTTGPLEKNAGQKNNFAFKYGYVEARVKVPKGQGLWPAFWLLPADGTGPPEIDLMEVLGNDTKTSYATVHWALDQASKSMTTIHDTDFADGFHTVGIRWNKNAIEWFYDGQRVKRFVGTDQIPHEQMFLLANLAVGGEWPGNANSTTPFPADYQVDWVKVWKPITG